MIDYLLFAALFVLLIGDAATTGLALPIGGTERNPLLRFAFRVAGMWPTLIISHLFGAWIGWTFARAHYTSLFGRVFPVWPFLSVLCLIFTAVVVNNIMVLKRKERALPAAA